VNDQAVVDPDIAPRSRFEFQARSEDESVAQCLVEAVAPGVERKTVRSEASDFIAEFPERQLFGGDDGPGITAFAPLDGCRGPGWEKRKMQWLQTVRRSELIDCEFGEGDVVGSDTVGAGLEVANDVGEVDQLDFEVRSSFVPDQTRKSEQRRLWLVAVSRCVVEVGAGDCCLEEIGDPFCERPRVVGADLLCSVPGDVAASEVDKRIPEVTEAR